MEKVSEQSAVIALEQTTVFPILFAIGFSHLLNDMIQSVMPSLYPMLKADYNLSFAQIGLITFVFQVTASLLQPFVGSYTDKHPLPFSFVGGMVFSVSGILLLAYATGFMTILLAAGLIGIGSSVFHPEASKVSYFASGGKRGLAQSIFQLGGNAGYALGPICVAVLVINSSQANIAWFAIVGLIAMILLFRIGMWYQGQLRLRASGRIKSSLPLHTLSRKKIISAISILLVLIFSKYFYSAAITNYFTFYLIDKFYLSVGESQVYLFVFLISIAAGTLLGGPLGDRFGRKIVIWFSILGAAPFTIMLPYADLFWTGILIVIIGLITSSSFSAILVYAQELLPGKVGMISGLFYGFAFGMGGLGSAVLGKLVDVKSIDFVFKVCSFLPLIGLVTVFLPSIKRAR